MYGLILATVRDLVIKRFGEANWKAISQKANIPEDFTNGLVYPDEQLYGAITGAAELLSLPAIDVIEAVGYWFVPWVKSTQYGGILGITGKNLTEVLQNINAAHGHMRAAHFHEMVNPIFIAKVKGPTSVYLQYCPGKETRVGLGPLVVGIIKAVAELQFNIRDLVVKHVKERGKDSAFEEYLFTWTEDDKQEAQVEYKFGAPGAMLATLFPFHFILDEQLKIVQVGPSVKKVLALDVGSSLRDLFTPISPEELSFESFSTLLECQTASIKISSSEIHPNVYNNLPEKKRKKARLIFEGQVISAGRHIYFVGTPVLESLKEAREYGLTIGDFAVYDPAKDKLFVSDAKKIKKKSSSSKEKSSSRESKSHKKSILKKISGEDNAGSRKSSSSSAPVQPVEHHHSSGTLVATLNQYVPRNLFGQQPRDSEDNDDNTSVQSAASIPPPRSASTAAISPPGASPADRKSLTFSDEQEAASNSPRTHHREDPHHRSSTSERKGHRGSMNLTSNNQVSSNWVPRIPETSDAEKSRFFNLLHEILLQDTWANFPITTILLDVSLNAVSQTDDLFSAIVRFYSEKGKAVNLLYFFLESEINAIPSPDPTTLFRAESKASRLMSRYLEQECGEYLALILASTLQRIAEAGELELDPNRSITGGDSNNSKRTKQKITDDVKTLSNIIHEFVLDVCVRVSVDKCPYYVRKIFQFLSNATAKKWPEVRNAPIANIFFLRYLGCAVLSPERFGLPVKGTISKRTAVLVSKAIQNMVNGIEFDGSKESYMIPMNPAIKDANTQRHIQTFFAQFQNVSAVNAPSQSPASPSASTGKHGSGSFPAIYGSNVPKLVDAGFTPATLQSICVIRDQMLIHMDALFGHFESQPQLRQIMQTICKTALAEIPLCPF